MDESHSLFFSPFKSMLRVYLSKRELMLLISYKKQSSSAPGADAEVVKTSLLTTSAAVRSFVAFKIMVPVNSSKRELMLLISY